MENEEKELLFWFALVVWVVGHLYLLFAGSDYKYAGERFWPFDTEKWFSSDAYSRYDMSEFCVYVLLPLALLAVLFLLDWRWRNRHK